MEGVRKRYFICGYEGSIKGYSYEDLRDMLVRDVYERTKSENINYIEESIVEKLISDILVSFGVKYGSERFPINKADIDKIIGEKLESLNKEVCFIAGIDQGINGVDGEVQAKDLNADTGVEKMNPSMRIAVKRDTKCVQELYTFQKELVDQYNGGIKCLIDGQDKSKSGLDLTSLFIDY